MMQIVGVGLMATFLALVVKEHSPLFAFLLTVFTGVFIFLFLIDEIVHILYMLEMIAKEANIHPIYFQTILKIISIAYIAQFGAQMAQDAGQVAISAKIELAGKILIIVLAIPILKAVIEVILSFIPS